MNEFKFSVLRNFGSEQFSFTANVHTENMTLTEEEILNQTSQVGSAVDKMFDNTCAREVSEKKKLTAQSKAREEANNELAAQLAKETKSAEDMKKEGSKLEKVANKS